MTTPREQLAKLIFFTDNRLIPTPEIEKGWKRDDNTHYAYTIADAIIQAGWTPPPTPAHNTLTDN